MNDAISVKPSSGVCGFVPRLNYMPQHGHPTTTGTFVAIGTCVSAVIVAIGRGGVSPEIGALGLFVVLVLGVVSLWPQLRAQPSRAREPRRRTVRPKADSGTDAPKRSSARSRSKVDE